MIRIPTIIYKTGLILFLGSILLTSCIPVKRIRYLQDPKDAKEERTDFKKPVAPEYRVHKGDNLYIRVISLDEKNNYFNEAAGINNYYTDLGIYLNSYTVNDSGFVDFPLIGRMVVIDQNIEEIRQKIQARVDEYVKNTVVIVKLANFRISMLGEFKNPGKYVVYQDKINIFEAIAMAGDMTDFAKRNKVLLIRQSDKGVKTYHLNLNDNRLLESDLFYLLPNDLVYVEPLKGKAFAFSEFPYVLILSTITTGLLLINYFQ